MEMKEGFLGMVDRSLSGIPLSESTEKNLVENVTTKNMPKRMSKTEYYLGIALAVSKRSTCLRRHYGAVIVNHDEIVSTGYNGNVRGEQNCCDRGTCQRLNHPHNSGDYSDCFSIHAEQNAMLSASRKEMLGGVLYLAGEEDSDGWNELKEAAPCPICLRMIKNSGITKVISKGGVLDVCNTSA